MKKNISVLAALALITSQTGAPASALGRTAAEQHLLCSIYGEITDLGVLQDELANLLENDPSNSCIDYLVQRLGGSPVAQLNFVADAY